MNWTRCGFNATLKTIIHSRAVTGSVTQARGGFVRGDMDDVHSGYDRVAGRFSLETLNSKMPARHQSGAARVRLPDDQIIWPRCCREVRHGP